LKKIRSHIDNLFSRIGKKTDSNFLFPFVVALVVVGIIVISLSFKFYLSDVESFYENFLVEAHGMLLDIIIFGLLFTFINLSRSKKLEIQRFKEEIDDFRHWTELVASYRIAGILRRLNKYKIDNLDLSDCYLKDAQLEKIYLKSATLEKANLEGADLGYADLQDANLKIANLQGADLRISNLQGADLKLANLQGANLRIVNFRSANLFSANLKGADLRSANLQNADLSSANLQDTDLSSADLRSADLRSAKLQGADLRNAKLRGADLRSTNLQDVKLGADSSLLDFNKDASLKPDLLELLQLNEVHSIAEAIMPDGTKFNKEWAAKIDKTKKNQL
jgi:uncharacterized protein YjbI with pentapeptide repeats